MPSPAASLTDLPLADGTGTVDQIHLGRPAGTRVAVIAVVAFVVVAGAIGSWAMTRSWIGGTATAKDDGSGSSPVVATMTVSPIDPGSAMVVQLTPNPPTPPVADTVGSAGSAATGSDGSAAAAPPTTPSHPPALPPNHIHHPGTPVHHPPAPPPPPPPPPSLTSQAVGAKFQQASREYRVYKDKYGQRLDAEWNDLAVWVQNHGNELEEAAKRIDAFRSKLH